MRRIRYCVAMSLDGYIAGPHDEADWIVMDPDMNFAELWSQFDTLLMGRRTYEAAVSRLGPTAMRGTSVVVASRTFRHEDHPDITIIPDLNHSELQALRQQNGKDIWMMGGGDLFRYLLTLQQVDTVEVSIVPVLLGEGVPLLPPIEKRTNLKLTEHKVYHSGVVALTYQVNL